jgi:hypothetical protein
MPARTEPIGDGTRQFLFAVNQDAAPLDGSALLSVEVIEVPLDLRRPPISLEPVLDFANYPWGQKVGPMFARDMPLRLRAGREADLPPDATSLEYEVLNQLLRRQTAGRRPHLLAVRTARLARCRRGLRKLSNEVTKTLGLVCAEALWPALEPAQAVTATRIEHSMLEACQWDGRWERRAHAP